MENILILIICGISAVFLIFGVSIFIILILNKIDYYDKKDYNGFDDYLNQYYTKKTANEIKEIIKRTTEEKDE